MAANNPYIRLNRVEFVLTNVCTGRCRHCSFAGELISRPAHIDKQRATDTVRELAGAHDITSVMAFGGEPLLYMDTACAVMSQASRCNIPTRQIITNGYFSNDAAVIEDGAKRIKASGVNNLLLSVDVFHKEFIPLERVLPFATELVKNGQPGLRLHPAWVVNRQHDNLYNAITERCLSYFSPLNIPVSRGNDITPEGNAVKYLARYYNKQPLNLDYVCGTAKYTTRLDNVNCISINYNGDVVVCYTVIGNINNESITDIINRYNPYKSPLTAALLKGGVRGLVQCAAECGITADESAQYTPCGVCADIMRQARAKGIG